MTSSPSGGTARPRGRGAATRRALLDAARELFATDGYEGTTVRAVAERAGVNQALLFRHFGSKDALFAEAVTEPATALLHAGPPEELLGRVLTAMLADDRDAGLFLAALRSGGLAEAVGAEVGGGYQRAFAALAETGEPDDAAVRADLLLAWLLGLALARSVLRTPALAAADPDTVCAHVVRTARTLVGPAVAPPPEPR
jgi:AcrR family transcriptional regulator